MRHIRYRVDPDVEISRVLNQLLDYYDDKKYEEHQIERAKRPPIYEKRHEYGCYLDTGKPLSEEDRENLRKELAGEIRGDIDE